MLHLRVYLLAFLVLGVIAADFADSSKENRSNIDCNKEVPPGSESITLSLLEKKLKVAIELKKQIENIRDKWNKWMGKESKKKETSSRISHVVNKMKDVKWIPPGMEWCGDGNTAESEDHLGYFNETDACCRSHDNCQNNMLAGETLLNLKNNGIFTKSAYYCDNEFYSCLKNVVEKSPSILESVIAEKIGMTYFNLLKPQCFKCVCPTPECKEGDETECKGMCARYAWVNSSKF